MDRDRFLGRSRFKRQKKIFGARSSSPKPLTQDRHKTSTKFHDKIARDSLQYKQQTIADYTEDSADLYPEVYGPVSISKVSFRGDRTARSANQPKSIPKTFEPTPKRYVSSGLSFSQIVKRAAVDDNDDDKSVYNIELSNTDDEESAAPTESTVDFSFISAGEISTSQQSNYSDWEMLEMDLQVEDTLEREEELG